MLWRFIHANFRKRSRREADMNVLGTIGWDLVRFGIQYVASPRLFPVDLFIPGCPPHPLTILDGLLRLVGKIKNK